MPRKKKQTIDWVTMGPSPYFATCQRCGGHVEPPKLPMRIEAFIKYSDYALELHRYCKDAVLSFDLKR